MFHILDIGDELQKVVVIFNAEKQDIRLLRVYDDGGVDKEFSFPVDFYPDYFTIEHLEGRRYKLLASELGRDEYYTVDFDKRIVCQGLAASVRSGEAFMWRKRKINCKDKEL